MKLVGDVWKQIQRTKTINISNCYHVVIIRSALTSARLLVWWMGNCAYRCADECGILSLNDWISRINIDEAIANVITGIIQCYSIFVLCCALCSSREPIENFYFNLTPKSDND